MRTILLLLILLACVFPVGCDDDFKCNCDREIDDFIDDHGEPEEIVKYDSDDYHYRTLWYWCEGYSKKFEWGYDVDGCCEEGTYHFEPVCD